MEHKVKIVCTLGPASLNREILGGIVDAGMNVARLNFSHGTHESHLEALRLVRDVAAEKKTSVAVMLDTKGPEIRTTLLENDQPVALQQGQFFELRPDDGSRGCDKWVCVTHPTLARECAVGQDVFIDDGTIHLKIVEIRGDVLVCKVIVGGLLSNRKGINVPDAEISLPTLSDKDKADILWGVENDVDFIAVSFVRNRDDVLAVRRVIEEAGGDIKLIAKIESRKAVERLDEIADVVDGMMVARGDLGVEVPLEDVPSLQKKLIQRGIAAGKPVITATQMLDSMIKNPRPTRAEATDVANAIYDGTSAIMLSGESAVGAYPVEAVETMVRIALRAEADMDYIRRFSRDTSASTDVTNAISHATVTSAHDLNASAIITVTKSGSTARILSRYRPACVIVGCTTEKHVWRQLALSWGTVPLMIAEESNTDDLFEHAVDAAVQNGLVHDGELVVLTAGVPLGISGTTNLMKVHVVGHLLSRGQGLHGGKVVAPLCVIRNLEKDAKDFNTGDVIVCHQTTREMFSMLRKSSAIVLEDDNPEGHGAIAGMSLDIPVIIGAKNATNILKSGAVVTVDGEKGTVSAN